MYIETERLIIRDFNERDAEALLTVKYDVHVLEYSPTFIKRDATIDDAKEAIKIWQSIEGKDIFEKGANYAICLKSSGDIIGAVTVGGLEYLYELQIGWMMNSSFTGQGYASEAGAAASDYLLDYFVLDYISVVMDVDNPASFRTAQKSGFKLFEKRVPYDYHYSSTNVENFNEVAGYFANNQSTTGSCYYYFRKFRKDSKITTRYYGDTPYNGRFS